jgi:hypothetical protein
MTRAKWALQVSNLRPLPCEDYPDIENLWNFHTCTQPTRAQVTFFRLDFKHSKITDASFYALGGVSDLSGLALTNSSGSNVLSLDGNFTNVFEGGFAGATFAPVQSTRQFPRLLTNHR